MAMLSCTRIPAVCAGAQGPRRSYARVSVCASLGGNQEASALNRRAAVLLGLSPLLLSGAQSRAEFLDLNDSRATGAKDVLERQDQARDDNLDERRRFAFESVGKLGTDEHKARAKESYGRLQRDVKYYLDKKLLNRVSNELGLQIANLRYDLEQIANASDKSARKAAQKESKQAIKALEQLDLYARLNKPSEANEAYSEALQKIGNIVKSYG